MLKINNKKQRVYCLGDYL